MIARRVTRPFGLSYVCFDFLRQLWHEMILLDFHRLAIVHDWFVVPNWTTLKQPKNSFAAVAVENHALTCLSLPGDCFQLFSTYVSCFFFLSSSWSLRSIYNGFVFWFRDYETPAAHQRPYDWFTVWPNQTESLRPKNKQWKFVSFGNYFRCFRAGASAYSGQWCQWSSISCTTVCRDARPFSSVFASCRRYCCSSLSLPEYVCTYGSTCVSSDGRSDNRRI